MKKINKTPKSDALLRVLSTDLNVSLDVWEMVPTVALGTRSAVSDPRSNWVIIIRRPLG